MHIIKMAKYDLKSAIDKIGRVFSSGRAANYFNRAKGLYEGVRVCTMTQRMTTQILLWVDVEEKDVALQRWGVVAEEDDSI